MAWDWLSGMRLFNPTKHFFSFSTRFTQKKTFFFSLENIYLSCCKSFKFISFSSLNGVKYTQEKNTKATFNWNFRTFNIIWKSSNQMLSNIFNCKHLIDLKNYASTPNSIDLLTEKIMPHYLSNIHSKRTKPYFLLTKILSFFKQFLTFKSESDKILFENKKEERLFAFLNWYYMYPILLNKF